MTFLLGNFLIVHAKQRIVQQNLANQMYASAQTSSVTLILSVSSFMSLLFFTR